MAKCLFALLKCPVSVIFDAGNLHGCSPKAHSFSRQTDTSDTKSKHGYLNTYIHVYTVYIYTQTHTRMLNNLDVPTCQAGYERVETYPGQGEPCLRTSRTRRS